MTADVYTDAIEFIPQGDMIGQKYGVYVYELGVRKILLSPAAYSIWKTDKSSFYRSFEVWKDGEIIPIMDVGGSL